MIETNRHTEAEPLCRRALAILEKSFGPDYPDVAICLSNLAALLTATNRHTEAEPFSRRALAILEKRFGPDHPTVARGLNNLVQLLHETYRYTEVGAAVAAREELKVCRLPAGGDRNRTIGTRKIGYRLETDFCRPRDGFPKGVHFFRGGEP